MATILLGMMYRRSGQLSTTYDNMVSMPRRKYKDDYKIIKTADEQGRERRSVEYIGDFFEVSLDEAALHKVKKRCKILLFFAVGFHLWGGFLDNQGMYHFFVSLPYVIAFYPMIKIGEGLFRLPREERGYRRDEKELSFDRIKAASIALITILGVGLIGEIIFLLIFARDSSVIEYQFIVLEILAAFCASVIFRLVQPINFQIKTDSLDE